MARPAAAPPRDTVERYFGLVETGRIGPDDRVELLALLVIEVADASLTQDRITKAAIYAAAGIPEYWLVNLRDDCVEVFRAPDPGTPSYRESTIAHRGERIALASLPDASVAVDDLLPRP